jgi:hypothetical protein
MSVAVERRDGRDQSKDGGYPAQLLESNGAGAHWEFTQAKPVPQSGPKSHASPGPGRLTHVSPSQ